jgi:hypothetical protein
MAEPVVPPPPPPTPPGAPKQGLSTGAKIAIGCLVAVVLCVGGCFVVTAVGLHWAGKKVKNFAENAEKNPNAAAVQAVELMVKFNPEVEVVSSDPDAGTITLREKKTGKVVKFNAEDIKNGKFSFESDGEKVNVEANGDNGGSFKVESSKGRFAVGGAADAAPDWVPVYPGARADSYSNLEANGEKSGTFTIHTADPAEKVLAYYKSQLEGAGFKVEKSTLESTAAFGGNLTATAGARSVNVTVATQEGETQGLVAYSEKP